MRCDLFLFCLACFTPALAIAKTPGNFNLPINQNAVVQSDETETTESISELGPKAQTAFSKGEYEKAYTLAVKICQLQPENVRYQLFLGEVSFAAGKMKECVAAYDQAIRLTPAMEPRLWQRGLALYYAQQFADGVKQFETHQTVNSQDVENAVWHLLCAARVSDVDAARKKLIPISGDTRIPMSQIYEMFAGRMTPDQVLERAQKSASQNTEGSTGQRLPLYYAHLYTGLYYEMLGNQESATKSLKKATEVNPLGKTNFMGQVARVHLKLLAAKTEK